MANLGKHYYLIYEFFNLATTTKCEILMATTLLLGNTPLLTFLELPWARTLLSSYLLVAFRSSFTLKILTVLTYSP